MGDLLVRTWDFVLALCLDGFVAAIAVAVVAPLLGAHLVLRRMPFLAIATPQIAGAGAALAYLVWPLWAGAAGVALQPDGPPAAIQLTGAGVAVALGLCGLALSGRRRGDTGLHAAIAWLVALGATEVFLLESPYAEVAHQSLHHGRLLTVLPEGRDLVAGAAAVAGLGLALGGRRFARAAFDPDLARLRGERPALGRLALLALIGGFCAVTAPIVGPEIVLSLLILPPAILRGVTPSLAAYGPLAALAGVSGTLLAFVLAVAGNWLLGPALIVAVAGTSLALGGALRLAEAVRARG